MVMAVSAMMTATGYQSALDQIIADQTALTSNQPARANEGKQQEYDNERDDDIRKAGQF